MVRVRKARTTITSAIILDYDRLMEDYGIDLRREEESPSEDNSGKEYSPGNIPFGETDAGGKADDPF